jgi:hypothetical protein
MTRYGFAIILAASVMAPACTDNIPQPPPPTGDTTGGQTTTFDHDNSQINPFDLLARIQQEGPPRYTSHVHSCAKVRYATLGNVLASLGINPANNANNAVAAGSLYSSGFNALGGPNYANRIRENILVSTSGASREFDIFAAGAPETLTTLAPNNTFARCPGVQVIDTSTTPATCRADGITCLIGFPATATHLSLCNLSIQNASTPAIGQQLAVAAMLAAAYTCE